MWLTFCFPANTNNRKTYTPTTTMPATVSLSIFAFHFLHFAPIDNLLLHNFQRQILQCFLCPAVFTLLFLWLVPWQFGSSNEIPGSNIGFYSICAQLNATQLNSFQFLRWIYFCFFCLCCCVFRNFLYVVCII